MLNTNVNANVVANATTNENDVTTVFEFASSVSLLCKFNDSKQLPVLETCFFNPALVKQLNDALQFNDATDKIDYAWGNIDADRITEDTNMVTIEWTVYSQLNADLTEKEARDYILQHLIQKYDKLMNIADDNYYINFGFKLFKL